MADRHEEEARDLLRQHGQYIRETKHGEMWEVRGQRIGLPSCSPSDRQRAWKNTLADIRRALREDEEGVVSDQGPVDGDPDGTAFRMGMNVIGVHLAPVKTTQIVREEHEVVVPLAALAPVFRIPVAEAESYSISVTDVNGEEIEGPVTIKVTREVVK